MRAFRSIAARWRLGCWLLSALPLAVLLLAVSRYYFPFPWAESYVMFPSLLEKWYLGELHTSDLYLVQNGYVVFVPCVFHVLLGVFTHWNQAWEVSANVLLGIALFWIYIAALKRTCRLSGLPFPHALVPLVALLTFSLNQSCNWMWSAQLMTFLSVASAAAGLLVLSHPRSTPWHILGGACLGIVATLSFGTGLAFWPAGLIVLLLGSWECRAGRLARVFAWCLISGVTLFVWLWSVRRGNGSTVAAVSLEKAWFSLRFLPIFLGAGLVKFHLDAAFAAGMVVLGVGLTSHVYLWSSSRVSFRALLPFTALMLYALGLGMSPAFGHDAATESVDTYAYGSLLEGAALRYPLMAQPFVIGLVFLLWIIATQRGIRLRGSRLMRGAAFVAIGLVAACSLLSSRTGYFEAQERYRLYAPQARKIVMDGLLELPTRLQWPYGNTARNELRIMREYRLSIFREEAQAFWRRTKGNSNWD